MPDVTDASADYCEHCDLPRSQCVHGQPPPPTPAKAVTAPAKAVTAPPKPRKRPTTRRSPAPEEPVRRRWTPPEVFEPLILTVLRQAGGTLDADDAFAELEVLAQDRLLPGDTELTPGGELRWRHAARRARMALIDEGLMTKTTPGVWQISGPGTRSR
jgi:hypothetical protein